MSKEQQALFKKNVRSDWEGIKHVVVYFSLIFASFYATYYTFNSNLILINHLIRILNGYLLMFLFHGLHECVHETPFYSKKLNLLFANLFGFLCFRPFLHYKYYHWAHHKHTGNKKFDPELQNTFIDLKFDKNIFNYIAYCSGIAFWIDRIVTLIRHFLHFILKQSKQTKTFANKLSSLFCFVCIDLSPFML